MLLAVGVGMAPLVTEVVAAGAAIMPKQMTAAMAAMPRLALRLEVWLLISLVTSRESWARVPHSLAVNVLGAAISELSVGECLSIAGWERICISHSAWAVQVSPAAGR